MPGRCAEALPKNGLFDGNVLELCTDAKSTHPASSYAHLLKSLKRPTESFVAIPIHPPIFI